MMRWFRGSVDANESEATSESPNDIASILGPECCVKGDVEFEAGIRIDGVVQGNVIGRADADRKSAAIIGQEAEVHGDVYATCVHVYGKVSGSARAKNEVVLHEGAYVGRDVEAPVVNDRRVAPG
ncbi:polymer-forming cytoskeletal protein [Myxococcota bacterium]